MSFDTSRAKKPCVTCGKNLAGHTRDILKGKRRAHPFVTEHDPKKPKR